MSLLDPGKLLVVLTISALVLGAERLPEVARRLSGAYRAFASVRERAEQGVSSLLADVREQGSTITSEVRADLAHVRSLPQTARAEAASVMTALPEPSVTARLGHDVEMN